MKKEPSEKPALSGWKMNLLFALAVLALAAAIGGCYWYKQAHARPDKWAHLVYGTGERQEIDIDLREDADYTFSSNGYDIHLKVQDGTIAFVDSPCPDHLCESFGQLSEVYDWAACLPAQAMLTIEAVE